MFFNSSFEVQVGHFAALEPSRHGGGRETRHLWLGYGYTLFAVVA